MNSLAVLPHEDYSYCNNKQGCTMAGLSVSDYAERHCEAGSAHPLAVRIPKSVLGENSPSPDLETAIRAINGSEAMAQRFMNISRAIGLAVSQPVVRIDSLDASGSVVEAVGGIIEGNLDVVDSAREIGLGTGGLVVDIPVSSLFRYYRRPNREEEIYPVTAALLRPRIELLRIGSSKEAKNITRLDRDYREGDTGKTLLVGRENIHGSHLFSRGLEALLEKIEEDHIQSQTIKV